MCNNNYNLTINIVILGGGESGIGAAMLAKKVGYKNIFLSDNNRISNNNILLLKYINVSYEMYNHSLDKILSANLIIKSPGISNDSYIIKLIKQKKIEIISEIEFAYINKPNIKIIGVTGTNGKTTVATLIYKLLKAARYKVSLSGNIGSSFSRIICKQNNYYDYYIVEISSFQLENIIKLKPFISVITNISEDHMDRYKNIHEYLKAKLNITKNQSKKDYCIYNNDNTFLCKYFETISNVQLLKFTLKNKKIYNGIYLKKNIIYSNIWNNEKKFDKNLLNVIGDHNIYNFMIVILVGNILKVNFYHIEKLMSDFKGIKHRLEYCNSYNNITFINDSKSTNLDCVFWAMKSIPSNIIWITGGIDKGNNYENIKNIILKKVIFIICVGKNSNIYNYFSEYITIISVINMSMAIKYSLSLSKPKYTVLLSPGCSSQNMYKSYKHRGNIFKKYLKKILYDERR
ncbi:MAG: UDP-N-acetylmuramoyl-L-alanine--D-glutamate ligase [Bacteroides sp.]|nr:MAG: UDP-N-acetylmuramoyl-L-alanine--D-glutamate ligase [Bacteroides sp.]